MMHDKSTIKLPLSFIIRHKGNLFDIMITWIEIFGNRTINETKETSSTFQVTHVRYITLRKQQKM